MEILSHVELLMDIFSIGTSQYSRLAFSTTFPHFRLSCRLIDGLPAARLYYDGTTKEEFYSAGFELGEIVDVQVRWILISMNQKNLKQELPILGNNTSNTP